MKILMIAITSLFLWNSIHAAVIQSGRFDKESNQIKLLLTYGGGCEEHTFELEYSPVCLETYPAQCSANLKQTAGFNDFCEAMITKEYSFPVVMKGDHYLRIRGDNNSQVEILVQPQPAAIDKLCHEKLLGSFDSEHYFYSEYEIYELSPEKIELPLVLDLIKDLGKKQGCTAQEMTPDLKNSKCSNILPDRPDTLVCYVETGAGYFYATFDSLGGVNLIFNRYD